MEEIKYNAQDITKHMGERLVMFQLMKYRNWEVDYVDYVGADLIAIDREKNQKYAISVKTKNHETDGHSCSLFKNKDAKKLREFAADMSDSNPMIPVVAYVIVKLDGTICTFLINLDDLDEMRNEGKMVKSGNGGYLFIYGNQNHPNNVKTQKGRERNLKLDAENFEKVLNEQRISHIVTSLQSVRMDNNLYKSWNWNEYNLDEEMYSIQQGSFGERYIIWRARDYGMRAYAINTVGVDVVLQEIGNKNNKYAVSIKTFSKKIKDGYEFEAKNVEHLKEYSSKWRMTPLVSLVFIIYNGDKSRTIYNINMKLDYIERKAVDNNIRWIKCCKGKKNLGGYRFKWDKKLLEELKNDKDIVFTKMVIE